MRHWLQIATRDWRTRPARSALSVLAVALGVAVVTWVTGSYESVRRSINEAVLEWIGRSHVIVEPVEGVWALFSQDVEALVAAEPGVAATTCRTREYVEVAPLPRDRAADPAFQRIEVTGVMPASEPTFRPYRMSAGRFLRPDDENGLLVEAAFAAECGVGVGDEMLLRDPDAPHAARRFRILGLVDRRRASLNQAPMTWARLADVQALTGLHGRIKSVDAILADPRVANLQAVARGLRQRIEERNRRLEGGEHQSERLEVKTTEAQHQKLGAAQGLLQFIVTLLSCAVLLTAFFIILASMSMGVSERIRELGLLRCVGARRAQAAGLVLAHTIPLGLAGTALGLPLGVGLQWLTLLAAPAYVGSLAISPWCICLAAFGGLATTLLASVIPAFLSASVSPAQAARPHATTASRAWVWAAALAGLLLLGAQEMLRRRIRPESAEGLNLQAIYSLVALYAASALLAPAIVALVGRAAAAVVAISVRLRPELLQAEIGKAPFRAAAICSGLMVGLSLIVGLVVWGESIKQGWQFPREFPDAMLYSYSPLPLEAVRALRDTEGVAQFTVADDFSFSLSKPSILRPFRLLDQFSRFLAIDPEEGFSLVKLAFLEGSERDALARLRRGGHLLITREFAQARGLHLDDPLTLWVDDTRATFRIAGVIASPGLDIAISFFNATTYFQTYAVGAVIGTLDDARKLFGRNYGKLILMNFAFARGDESPIPSAAARVHGSGPVPAPGQRVNFALGPGPLPGDGPEERIVNQMLVRLGDPPKAFVTARELKRQIERNIDRVTLLLSTIPLVGLVVSALGLANVMASSVAHRIREIALLRAIGITRGQTLRLVIAEALVIGMLGSLLGLGLGLMLGRATNSMTLSLWGLAPSFTVPWGLVAAGSGLAILLCLLAALVPAHHASRHNILSVLAEA
jgi:putative ABC transport system permease protein